MSAHGARRLGRMVDNLAVILGIESLCAAQGIGFRAPLETLAPAAPPCLPICAKVSPALAGDRYLAPDIEAATRRVRDGALARACGLDFPAMTARAENPPPATGMARSVLRLLPPAGREGRYHAQKSPENAIASDRGMTDPRHNIRDVFPPTGPEISAKSWLTEAPLRMLMNNLHPDVAENPHELVVYGGIGRAARYLGGFFDAIVAATAQARRGSDPSGAIGQAGGRIPHPQGRAARADRQFQPGAAVGRPGPISTSSTARVSAMYGQMTRARGSIVGTQGIVQGTTRLFARGRTAALRR